MEIFLKSVPRLPVSLVYNIWGYVGFPYSSELLHHFQLEDTCRLWHRSRHTHYCDRRFSCGCEVKTQFHPSRILQRLRNEYWMKRFRIVH